MDSKLHINQHNDQKDTLQKLYKAASSSDVRDTDAVTYIIEKTSRITSALLMLSALMDKRSAIKQSIERTSIGLVTDAAACGHVGAARRSLMTRLVSIGSLLDSAARAHQLSQKNTELLINELTALSVFVRDLALHEGRVFYDVHELEVTVPESVYRKDTPADTLRTYKSHQKDVARGTHLAPQAPYEGQSKDQELAARVADKGHYRDKVQEAQKDRRAIILGLLQRKDRITVKDVANVIKDCSDKTLQRELLALVGQGVLVKEGERRWSTYRLA